MAATRFSRVAAAAALCLAGCSITETPPVQMQTDAAIVGAPHPVVAQTVPPVQHRTVGSGRRSNVEFMSMLSEDCQSLGTVGSDLLHAPQHGTVQGLPGDGLPNFPPENPRSACNARLVPGVFITYRSERYYDGPDEFQVLFYLEGGREARVTYVVDVRRPAAIPKPMPDLAK